MIRGFAAAALMSACAAFAGQADAGKIKIGYVNTFSGPNAFIGNDEKDGFELALDHLGRKMGNLDVQVIYEDDQIKPEVGSRSRKNCCNPIRSTSLLAIIGRTCFWPP